MIKMGSIQSYFFNGPTTVQTVPVGSQFLKVCKDRMGYPVIWFLVPTDSTVTEERTFHSIGSFLDFCPGNWTFLDTMIMVNEPTFIFEEKIK